MTRFKAFALLLLGLSLVAAKAPSKTGRVYLTPEKVSLKAAETVTVEIRIDVKKTPVNSVQAVLQFPSNLLRVTSVDTAGSAFEVQAEETKADGMLRLVRGTMKKLTGSHPVAKVTFEAVAPGEASIAFSTSTMLLSSDTSLDVLKETQGATIQIK